MDPRRLTRLLLNFGHTVDHLCMLIFPTALLGMAVEFGGTYGELLPLSLGGFIAFGVGSLPAGWLGDRWSRHGMMVVFFIGIGVATIATGFASTPTEIAVGLTFVGLFAAIYHPVGIAMLVANEGRVGRVLGINGVWGNLGVAFAALVTGALVDLIHWRAAFFLPGAVSIAAGVFFWLRVPATLPAAAQTTRKATTYPQAVLVRAFLVLVLATVCGGVIFNATTVAIPKVFDERLNALVNTSFGIGVLACLVFVIAALAQLWVGGLIDRLSLRRAFLPVAMLQAPLLWLAGYASDWLMLVTAVAMMFVVFGQIPLNDAMVAKYTDERWRARAYALRYVLSFGASATAVPLVAYVHDRTGGFAMVFAVLGVVALGVMAAAWLAPREAESPAMQPAGAAPAA
jgi:MFS family permease